MDKGEAIQSVKDMCERHKQNHKHYPAIVQVSGEVWQALVEPGYIFPPHAEPSVRVPLMDMGGSFSLELGPLAPIPVVKVVPQLPKIRHDGTIDERYDMHVRMLGKSSIICIHAGVNEVFLYPKQALSLLAWLLQEQPTLEKLVKEQSGDGQIP